jgi:carboxyl-terminal processing protease
MTLRPTTLIGIVISMVLGISLGIGAYRAWLEPDVKGRYGRAFDEVLRQVHEGYVDEVAKEKLVENALKGMLHGLDEHSDFLDRLSYEDLQAETSGQFGGIGIELNLVDGYFTVIRPIDDTPASAAGLKPGDRLTEIDRESLKGKKLVDIVSSLRGKPGTPVILGIRRDGGPKLEVSLIRAMIEDPGVDGRLLEPGYGYIRISQFQVDTGIRFTSTIRELAHDNGGSLRGLVLDLRDNPGGVLQSSVDVADALLDEGLIVYTEGRLPSSYLRYRATRGDLLQGAPVVILINNGSASAAEVVAGALQDHGRAVVLGAKSYGKGSVQSVMPLSEDEAIKLTTAYYYTPQGRSIEDTGIVPDVPVDEASGDADGATLLLGRALDLLKAEQGEKLHARL